MFKDKLFLVMLVLGLLTIVAAAGVMTIQRGNGAETNPYMEVPGTAGLVAEETMPEPFVSVAGESNAQTEERVQETPVQLAENNVTAADTAGEDYADTALVGAGREFANALVLNFAEDSKLLWPVQGNVLLDYSMDSTIYHPTLEQYQCSPGVVIQSEVSTPVYAPANARVLEAGADEELGNYLVLDFGNEYTAVCGQLKEVQAVTGEYLEQGQLMGYVSEPTKYYSVEGPNVFLELKHQEQPIDPLDYLE